ASGTCESLCRYPNPKETRQRIAETAMPFEPHRTRPAAFRWLTDPLCNSGCILSETWHTLTTGQRRSRIRADCAGARGADDFAWRGRRNHSECVKVVRIVFGSWAAGVAAGAWRFGRMDSLYLRPRWT